jgi:Domain of unknown function (DUF4397)
MKFRRIAMAALAAACWLGGPAVAAASAGVSAAGTGWIRLAHLSPNTPPVDVYLYSFGDSSAQLVLRHVSYGTVSPYEAVAAGDYSVAMRAAGAAATTKPVLSASVSVQVGHAYTVAGMGPESGLRLQVLDDELTTPPGHALVRVIQASLRQHVVTVTYAGKALASDLAFGSVSSYQAVPPATATVRVTSSGAAADAAVTLASGTVHTLVVLDGTSGLMIDNLQDAVGSSAAPAGGAATGFGGTAPHGPPSPAPWLAVIAAGALLALAGGLRLRWPGRA